MVVANSGGLASISAQFQRSTTAQTATVRGVLHQMHSRALTTDKRSLQCDTQTLERGGSQSRNGGNFVSVGAVGFGPALQTSLIELEASQNFVYSANLDPGVPAGAYVLAAGGTEEIPAFQELLSMPEEVRNLRIDGYEFGDPAWLMRRDEPTEFSWRAPSVPNEDNVIFVDVVARTDSQEFIVSCAGYESAMSKDKGFHDWTLGSGWLSDIPEEAQTTLFFIRAHLRKTVSDTSETRLQGLRTFFTVVELEVSQSMEEFMCKYGRPVRRVFPVPQTCCYEVLVE
jgi:hypothetical protein